MSFGIPVRNGLAIGLLSSTTLSSRRGLSPAMYLNFLQPFLDSRITFSRGSNATLVDSTGKITYAPANLLLYSQEFDNGFYLQDDINTVANSTTAPDGTTTADTISDTAINSDHRLIANNSFTTVSGQSYTLSFFIKNLNRNFAQIAFATSGFSSTAYANFDLSTGVLGTVGAGTTATITAAGNGWYRCSITATASSSALTGLFVALITSATAVRAELYTGTGQSIYLWGAQLEPVTYQTTPGTYNATTTAAYYGPRFDYDPVTLAPKGLLIEEARTNLQTYSSDFSNVIWNKTNITVTAAATASPDGTVNAQRLQATATGATVINASPVAVAATSATYSIYVKQGTGASIGNTFLLRNSTTATILIGGTINYATGAWTYSTGSTGVTVSNAGNGWWRIQMAATTGITSGDLIHGYVGWGGSSATAGDFIFAYGAQLEAGAFATSYIPTVASTVTRSADVATITGTNFSSWYNQSEGSFVAVVDSGVPVVTSTYAAMSANDNSGSNRNNIFVFNGQWGGVTSVGGVDQASFLVAGSYTQNVVARMSYAYAANNFAFSVNGSAPSTDTSGSVPTVDRFFIGSSVSGGGVINGHIRQIAYYNTRLSNSQLQTLTAPSLGTTLSLSFTNQAYTVGV